MCSSWWRIFSHIPGITDNKFNFQGCTNGRFPWMGVFTANFSECFHPVVVQNLLTLQTPGEACLSALQSFTLRILLFPCKAAAFHIMSGSCCGWEQALTQMRRTPVVVQACEMENGEEKQRTPSRDKSSSSYNSRDAWMMLQKLNKEPKRRELLWCRYLWRASQK